MIEIITPKRPSRCICRAASSCRWCSGVSFRSRRRVRRADGPSGAGKSSILKMIYGNYRCDGGRIGIRHQGAVIDLATPSRGRCSDIRRATIGYVSQFLRAVPPGRHARRRCRALIARMARGRSHAKARARCCAASTFPSGSGRCRPPPSPAASSSGSTSRAASSPRPADPAARRADRLARREQKKKLNLKKNN